MNKFLLPLSNYRKMRSIWIRMGYLIFDSEMFCGDLPLWKMNFLYTTELLRFYESQESKKGRTILKRSKGKGRNSKFLYFWSRFYIVVLGMTFFPMSISFPNFYLDSYSLFNLDVYFFHVFFNFFNSYDFFFNYFSIIFSFPRGHILDFS